jgi:hypothetical protein
MLNTRPNPGGDFVRDIIVNIEDWILYPSAQNLILQDLTSDVLGAGLKPPDL